MRTSGQIQNIDLVDLTVKNKLNFVVFIKNELIIFRKMVLLIFYLISDIAICKLMV